MKKCYQQTGLSEFVDAVFAIANAVFAIAKAATDSLEDTISPGKLNRLSYKGK